MGNLQYLDYEGLKYYDQKLREKLSSLMPENGKDGQDGQDGEDGLTPFIGSNGNWWIGTEDTDVQAAGQDGATGADGATPSFRVTEEGMLQVHYGDENWANLGNIKGADGAAGDLSDAYEQGDDIVIKDSDNNGKKNIKVGLSKEFIVVKPLGQYTQGQPIPAGTTLYEIVEKLLGGKLTAEVTKRPKATYSLTSNTSKEYEVGTTVNHSITITTDLNGSYTTYNGATASTKTTTHTATETPASFNGNLTETKPLKATCTITSQSVNATNSDGTTEPLTISQSGSTASGELKLIPRMRMFIYKGALEIVSNGEIDRSILTEQSLVKADSPIVYTKSKGLLNNEYVYFFVPATGALTESCAAGKKWVLIADTKNTNGPKDGSNAPILGFEKLTTDGTAAGDPVIVKIEDASKTLRDYHVYRFKTGAPAGLGDATEVSLQFNYVSSTDSEPAMKYFKI